MLEAQLQRQSTSLGSLHSQSQGGTPRHLSTPSASLDKLQREDLLMHELDQVMHTLNCISYLFFHVLLLLDDQSRRHLIHRQNHCRQNLLGDLPGDFDIGTFISCQNAWTNLLNFPCLFLLGGYRVRFWHPCAQVLETRAELDSLDEIARCPLVAPRRDAYSDFFAATPQLLQSTASVPHFERELVQLLFPEELFLCVWADTLLTSGKADAAFAGGQPLPQRYA